MVLEEYSPEPLGYVITRVQVEGVWGYDEDQVALVISDSTGFGSQSTSYSGYTHHQSDHLCDEEK